jgi:hypothetical protein
MNRNTGHARVLMAQGVAALAYFFCVHGAHAAPGVNAHVAKAAQVCAAAVHARAA